MRTVIVLIEGPEGLHHLSFGEARTQREVVGLLVEATFNILRKRYPPTKK